MVRKIGATATLPLVKKTLSVLQVNIIVEIQWYIFLVQINKSHTGNKILLRISSSNLKTQTFIFKAYIGGHLEVWKNWSPVKPRKSEILIESVHFIFILEYCWLLINKIYSLLTFIFNDYKIFQTLRQPYQLKSQPSAETWMSHA